MLGLERDAQNERYGLERRGTSATFSGEREGLSISVSDIASSNFPANELFSI